VDIILFNPLLDAREKHALILFQNAIMSAINFCLVESINAKRNAILIAAKLVKNWLPKSVDARKKKERFPVSHLTILLI